ncbi:MAG: Cys-rich protein [bacterium]|nr:Cys-rich protein [bacterium]
MNKVNKMPGQHPGSGANPPPRVTGARKSSRLITWSPMIIFGLYVALSVGLKDRSESAFAGEIRPQAAANCERICNRMAQCALENFGDTPANRTYVPRLKENCFSGCLGQESRVIGCFQGQFDCGMLAHCTVHFLQQNQ